MKATLPVSLGIDLSFPIANFETAGGRRPVSGYVTTSGPALIHQTPF